MTDKSTDSSIEEYKRRESSAKESGQVVQSNDYKDKIIEQQKKEIAMLKGRINRMSVYFGHQLELMRVFANAQEIRDKNE